MGAVVLFVEISIDDIEQEEKGDKAFESFEQLKVSEAHKF